MTGILTLANSRHLPGVNFDFCAAYTALPPFLSALSATYTGASDKFYLKSDGTMGLKRANLFTKSEDFSGAPWSVSGASVSSGRPDPSGGTTAFKLYEDGTNGNHVMQYSFTAVGNTTYTMSFKVKANGRSTVLVYFPAAFSTAAGVVFTLSGSGSASVYGGSPTSYSITPDGNGYYRCHVSATSKASPTSAAMSLYLYNGASSYQGDGVSGVDVTCAQLERGDGMTDYVKTTGTATRDFACSYDPTTGLYGYLAEQASINVLKNSGWAGGGTTPTNFVSLSTGGTRTPSTSTYNPYVSAYTFSSTNVAESFYVNQAGIAASTTYTLQVYVESITGSLKANNVISLANVPAGTVVTYPVCQANPSGGTTNYITTGILTCQMVTSTTSGTADARFGLLASPSGTNSVRLSCPQLETGTYASSFILTYLGATYQRAADILTIALANVTGFSSAAYTLFADCRSIASTALAGRVVVISDGTSSNLSRVGKSATPDYTSVVVTSGSTQASATSAITTARIKLGMSCAANDIKFAFNGSAGTNDTSATMPTVTTLHIGADQAGSQLNGYIFNAKLITKALSQARLNQITA